MICACGAMIERAIVPYIDVTKYKISYISLGFICFDVTTNLWGYDISFFSDNDIHERIFMTKLAGLLKMLDLLAFSH